MHTRLPALVALLAALLALNAAAETAPATGPAKAGAAPAKDGATAFMPEKVGFTRLKYDGDAWDDGMMKHQAAEQNLLDFIGKNAGVATDKPQVVSLGELRRFTPANAPALVYLTGSGDIRIGKDDAALLRDFLVKNNATLLADCGNPKWDASFKAFAKLLFPDQPLQPIPVQDPLCQQPCLFPDGPPALWHHGGSKVQGVKLQDRWVVVYHPGDLNDAWKTGNSGLDEGTARRAFEFGWNVLYYAAARRAGVKPAVPPIVKAVTEAADPKDIPAAPDLKLFDESQVTIVKSAELGTMLAKLKRAGEQPRSRRVGSREFYRLEGTMVDVKWDGTTAPLLVKFGGKAYAQVVKRDSGLSDALDENMDAIFVLKSGKVVRICEAGKDELTEAELSQLFPKP